MLTFYSRPKSFSCARYRQRCLRTSTEKSIKTPRLLNRPPLSCIWLYLYMYTDACEWPSGVVNPSFCYVLRVFNVLYVPLMPCLRLNATTLWQLKTGVSKQVFGVWTGLIVLRRRRRRRLQSVYTACIGPTTPHALIRVPCRNWMRFYLASRWKQSTPRYRALSTDRTAGRRAVISNTFERPTCTSICNANT